MCLKMGYTPNMAIPNRDSDDEIVDGIGCPIFRETYIYIVYIILLMICPIISP